MKLEHVLYPRQQCEVNLSALVADVRNDGRPLVYQGVCSVSMGVWLWAFRVTDVSALCIIVHMTCCGKYIICTGC